MARKKKRMSASERARKRDKRNSRAEKQQKIQGE